MSPESRDLLALHLVPGIGHRLLQALLHRFGSAAAVLAASTAELAEVPHVSERTAEMLRESWARRDVDAEIALMEQHGVRLLQLGTPEYPRQLAQISAPPRFLYFRGDSPTPSEDMVALVGSRQCTSYGRRVAERLAQDLAMAGFTVVSGLARGIDGSAHRGALDAKGRTIAVLAGGLSKIYPPEHKDLADEVAGHGGLLAETPMRMAPMAGMFPARNRIISGLSRAVVVVEAHAKSGALITARHAAEQGREVFVVPGAVDSEASAGSLELLRQGAKLIRNSQDLLEDLRGVAPLFDTAAREEGMISERTASSSRTAPPAPPPLLQTAESCIWQALAEPRSVDELGRLAQLPAGSLAGILMTLELKRIIRRLPGNIYERFA